MEREKVLRAIEKELDYIDSMKRTGESHIVEDFPLSSGMEAIRYNLDRANEVWYTSRDPNPKTMDYIRKIAAICIQLGESQGMPSRTWWDMDTRVGERSKVCSCGVADTSSSSYCLNCKGMKLGFLTI